MSPGPTRICLLGRIAIQREGAPEPAATLTGRRAELVFAYLAVNHRRSVSRDELATALWPDLLPDTWSAALRGVLSEVRRFLERGGLDSAATLATEQGRLRLRLPDDATLDLEEATAALEEARAQLTAGDPAAAAAAATRAADAGEESFLPYHDEGWPAEVRGELDRLLVDALELQGTALATAGRPREALAVADRLIRADPFQESGHRLRIAMLAETGDRAGAAKAYERCKTILASELGIEPSAETAEVLRRALEQAAPAAPPLARAAALAPDAPAAQRGPGARYAGLRVLVVEDHDFQRRTTLTLMRGLGVGELQEASDGTEALAVLDRSAAPDIIICDLDMPGMDGVEFIRNVGERRLASAVVIASAMDDRVLETVRAASEGYGLQVLGAVRKPLTVAGLEGLLATYRPARRSPASAADPTGAAAALLASLDDRTLPVLFEPVVDLQAGRVAGIRVVARTPLADDLPAIVDEAGRGRQFAEHLLREARAAARPHHLDTYLELTPGSLGEVALADALAAISRDRVVLVAGSAALSTDQAPARLDLLARLRVKGYGLCADGLDAAALDRFPLTHVQLPAELVAAAAASGDRSPLVPAVDTAQLLGVPMIGRAVTLDEFEVLLQLGCSLAHGPYLAPAVPATQVGTVATNWAGPAAATADR